MVVASFGCPAFRRASHDPSHSSGAVSAMWAPGSGGKMPAKRTLGSVTLRGRDSHDGGAARSLQGRG